MHLVIMVIGVDDCNLRDPRNRWTKAIKFLVGTINILLTRFTHIFFSRCSMNFAL
jgi:hypothetical protein